MRVLHLNFFDRWPYFHSIHTYIHTCIHTIVAPSLCRREAPERGHLSVQCGRLMRTPTGSAGAWLDTYLSHYDEAGGEITSQPADCKGAYAVADSVPSSESTSTPSGRVDPEHFLQQKLIEQNCRRNRYR